MFALIGGGIFDGCIRFEDFFGLNAAIEFSLCHTVEFVVDQRFYENWLTFDNVFAEDN